MSRLFFSHLHRTFVPRLSIDEHRQRMQGRVEQLRRRYQLGDGEFAPYARDSGRTPTPVVVGAGFSGLMSAYMLSKNFRVRVFEARPRVGGRVFSLVSAKSKRVVEAGAELIGYNHPAWLLLAQQFDLGLLLLTTEDNLATLDLEMPMEIGGKVLSRSKLKETFEEMDEAFSSLSRKAHAVSDPYRPWLARGAGALDNTPLSAWIEGLSCSKMAKEAIRIDLENTNAAPAEQQGLLANLALVAGGAIGGKPNDFFNVSEVARCERGNDALAKALARKLIDGGGTLHLSEPVRKIIISQRDVTILVGEKRVKADYVVLAAPPSTWPSIEPAPPADYFVSMGVAVKYLSEVKSRFWLEEQISSNSSSEAYGNTWDGTDNQTQVDGQNITFSVFAGGKTAQRALRIHERQGQTGLQKFYGKALGSVYQNYLANLAKRPRFVAWPSKRWTRAGYSCFAPGEVCRTGPLFYKPYHDRLYFAGEHTCLAFFGYMEGALQSGLATSLSLIKTAQG